jgi:hypothetical protein
MLCEGMLGAFALQWWGQSSVSALPSTPAHMLASVRTCRPLSSLGGTLGSGAAPSHIARSRLFSRFAATTGPAPAVSLKKQAGGLERAPLSSAGKSKLKPTEKAKPDDKDDDEKAAKATSAAELEEERWKEMTKASKTVR